MGPNYHAPALDAPAAWTQGDGPAKPAGALEDAAWWQAFGDPILDRLMERAQAGNLDVAQAKARLRQARASLRQTRAGFFPSIDLTGSTNTSDSGLLDPSNKTSSRQTAVAM